MKTLYEADLVRRRGRPRPEQKANGLFTNSHLRKPRSKEQLRQDLAAMDTMDLKEEDEPADEPLPDEEEEDELYELLGN